MKLRICFSILSFAHMISGYPQQQLEARQTRDAFGNCICPATFLVTSTTTQYSAIISSVTITSSSVVTSTAPMQVVTYTATRSVTVTQLGVSTITASTATSTQTSATTLISTATASSTVTTCVISAAKRQVADSSSPASQPSTITITSIATQNGASFIFPCLCTPLNSIPTLSSNSSSPFSSTASSMPSIISDTITITNPGSIATSSTGAHPSTTSTLADSQTPTTTTFSTSASSPIAATSISSATSIVISTSAAAETGSHVSSTQAASTSITSAATIGGSITISLSTASSSSIPQSSPTTTVSSACSCSQPPVTSSVIITSTIARSIGVTVVTTSVGRTVISLTSTTTLTVTSTSISIVGPTVTVTPDPVTLTIRPISIVAVTVTPTLINCPTPSTTCNNTGVRWGFYNNTDSKGVVNTNSDSTYSSFDPTLFKTRPVVYQNITYSLGGLDYPNPTIITIYNSTVKFNSAYFTLNHVGYIFAQVTGSYTFSVSGSDDITLLWVGSKAYSGYTRANANAVNVYGAGTTTYVANFVAGTYYPVRIIFGNAQGAVIFKVTLTAPDGRVILNPTSKASQFLVQYSCDGVLAPQFPAFGSET